MKHHETKLVTGLKDKQMARLISPTMLSEAENLKVLPPHFVQGEGSS